MCLQNTICCSNTSTVTNKMGKHGTFKIFVLLDKTLIVCHDCSRLSIPQLREAERQIETMKDVLANFPAEATGILERFTSICEKVCFLSLSCPWMLCLLPSISDQIICLLISRFSNRDPTKSSQKKVVQLWKASIMHWVSFFP